ncbi:hypothetical protein CRG98_049874 [Punica granatum]|uniref:Uncharacterized protein n=1 Tax=Punica granatum TaxID=22663 RepID=A0A2I0H1P0_PUNGR|nr:hypothetical protein CRG98_049874 [Punica granatum]
MHVVIGTSYVCMYASLLVSPSAPNQRLNSPLDAPNKLLASFGTGFGWTPWSNLPDEANLELYKSEVMTLLKVLDVPASTMAQRTPIGLPAIPSPS